MADESNISDDLDHCYNALQSAKEFQLEPEVVLFALRAMKNNPDLTIEEALVCGLDEWDLI